MVDISLYQTQLSSQDIDDMIKKYSPIVKKIAYHMISRLPHSVEIDDIIQVGMMGLMEAYKQYDVTKGASFETYAGIRIRGAILDDVRKNDWFPRSVYRNSRMIANAIRKVEATNHRAAKDVEIAAELNMTLDEYHKVVADISLGQLCSLEELVTPDEIINPFDTNSQNPSDELEKEKFSKVLAKKIEDLPDREKLVLSLYYDKELNLKEIGEVLEVSESRICQIMGQALMRLKSKLIEWN